MGGTKVSISSIQGIVQVQLRFGGGCVLSSEHLKPRALPESLPSILAGTAQSGAVSFQRHLICHNTLRSAAQRVCILVPVVYSPWWIFEKFVLPRLLCLLFLHRSR